VWSLVLIIDPDQIERRYIAAILAADGFDLVQVASVIEGLVQAARREPSLVILAEETAPVSVEDAIAVLRRLTGAPLMVVGDGGGGEGVATLRAGGDFFLARPFTAPELAGRARMLVRRGREGRTEETGAEQSRQGSQPPASGGPFSLRLRPAGEAA